MFHYVTLENFVDVPPKHGEAKRLPEILPEGKRLKIVFLIPYAWTKLLLEESFEKL